VRRLFPFLLLIAAAVLLAACGGADEETAPPPQQPPPATETEAEPPAETVPPDTAAEQDPQTVRVYLMRGEHLGVGDRGAGAGPAVGRAALEALLDGPTPDERAAGLESEIPEGTQLLDLSIDEDGLAVVDLTRDFESGGGSLSMQARVAQVVFTLTQFPTIDRVSFRLGGEDVDAIGGEGIPASAVERADFEDVTPAILVESPTPGQRLASPIRLQGMSSTFEATFQFELFGPGGELLVEDFVTATAGGPEWGTFDDSFPFEVGSLGDGRLVVFEISAEDGSRLHELEIPLELAP
jgi:germination protein M